MAKNNKRTSPDVAHMAAGILRDPKAPAIQKSFAASLVSQANTGNQTGADMESRAGRALQSDKYGDTTKTLAASLVSQSNKAR